MVVNGFPASAGHTLVTTRRHVSDFFDVIREEGEAICETVWHVRERLQAA